MAAPAPGVDTFDPSLVELMRTSESGNDEGDYDCYDHSTLYYNGEKIYRKNTSSHSNCSGAWGEDHTAELSADKRTLVVVVVGHRHNLGSVREETASAPETIDVVGLFAAARESAAAAAAPAAAASEEPQSVAAK